MYAEITKVKKLTIAQYVNNVQLYFDAVTFPKLHIDQKNPTACTKDDFIPDIFLQLKNESLPVDFHLGFSCQETCWMMNKSFISSQDLIDDTSAYYVNLKNTGAQKIELSKYCQIIAFTTELSELKAKIAKISTNKGSNFKKDEAAPASGNKPYVFEFWPLEKFDYNAVYNMAKQNGKTWYWCPNHCNNNNRVVTNGMYIALKPEDHERWQKDEDKLMNCRKGRNNSTESAPINEKPKALALVINNSAASKLLLSKALQAALVTTAGLTEDQFNKIWADVCSTRGN